MRLFFVGRSCAFGGLLLSVASIASAVPTVAPAHMGATPLPDLNAVTANDTYTMFSGVGNGSTGNLFLVENTTTPTGRRSRHLQLPAGSDQQLLHHPRRSRDRSPNRMWRSPATCAR
jgi:hypothetical protein